MYADRLKEIDWRAAIESNVDWTDPNFTHDIESLLDPTIRLVGEKSVEQHERWRRYVWKRPQEVYGEGNFDLYDQPRANDIKQGRCGDCYFLASLCALAEYPDRISRIFLTHEVNIAGCYAVELFVNGEKRTVVVDDYFPYDEESETWAFAQPSRTSERHNEIWVLILEKAWAKVFGSYSRIEGGSAGEAFYPLTGSGSQIYWHEEIQDLEGYW